MSSFDEIRSSLLKKYNVSAAGTSGSTNTQTAVTQEMQPNTATSDFYTIRSNLLDKYSPEKTTERQNAVNDWATRFNNAMQGVSDYDQKRNGGFTRDASGGFSSEINALIADFDNIKDYADRMGMPNSQRYLNQLKQLQNSIGQINDSFSQFEDEDAYNRYMDYWKDIEEKRNLDLDAYSRGITELEQQLEDYTPEFNWEEDKYHDLNPQQVADAEINRMQEEIDRRKRYLAQAQRIQQKDVFSAVANPESEKYDAAFESKSGYVSTEHDGKLQRMMSQYSMGYDDLTYEYINNQNGIRDTIKQKAGAYKKGETPFEAKGYDYMTEDEVGLYNYYYSMGGKASAEAYLDTIQEDLNQRKAAGMYQQMEGKTGAEMVFGVEAGLDQFKGGIKGAVRVVKGDDSYVAPSATQYASGMVREDLADDGAKLPSWLGGASVGQVGYDAITTTANMAPSIAVGMLNPTMGAAAMGASAAGSAYQEKLNEGYSKEQARKYGIAVGASETALGAALSGIKTLGGAVTNHVIGNALKGVKSGIGRFLIKFGGSVASEALEEGIQEILTPLFSNYFLNTDENVNWSEVAYSALLGGLSAGVLEGPTAVSAARNGANSSDNVTKPATGLSKMETVQQTGDIDSFAQQFGTQANEVRRNYLEGQLKHEPENLQEYQVGFMAAYTIGWNGGKVESLSKHVPYLSQSQREIAFSLGRDAAAAQKAAEPKKAVVTAKMTTEEGTQDVTIAEVVGMDDTTMTFRLEDGRTVTDNDLDFEKGQLLMSAVWELGMDAKTVNSILQETAGNAAADSDLAAGIQEAHHYGQHGYTMEQLTKHGADAAVLTDGQRKAAWEAGRKLHLQKAEATPGGGMKVSGKTAGVWFDAGGGDVRAFDEADTSGLSETALAGARTAKVLQKLGIGRNYYFYESYVNSKGDRVYKDAQGVERIAPNGWYDPDGSIHIDLNAGAEGKGLTMYTLSHELTHFVEKWSPKKYQALADFLVSNYAKAGNVDAMVAEKQAQLSESRGSAVSYEEAYSEFIADSMEAMLADGNVLEKLQELKKTDRSLFDKIREFFGILAKKIREIYKDLTPDSLEGQAVLQMKDQIDQIQQLFAEAMVEASENFQAAAEIGLEVDMDTESVSPAVMYSERTWKESEYVQERSKAAKEIAKAIGVTEKKAGQYIDDVNGIARMIAEDRTRLDYFSSPGRSSFISNVEYGGSFDFSTLCKKRRLLTGTFTAIQKALPNTALTANEILDIRNRMKNAKLEVSCGLCYVEGSRANMGQFAKEFLRLYKQYYPDAWQPNMADVNTPDGIEWVRINHPECYEQYEYFWNHYGTLKAGDKNLFASQQKPKLYQLHTEYKGEILQKFNGDDNVEEKNLNGGIRLQSFSDFEIVHLIDTMQIIMDMSRVGLAGQAYTKVPDFAWALGDTGLKINLSLIAKGVDESGKLIFDDIEGMPIAEAMKLRDRYSANVGTILVAFNDAQLMAAMADDRVDFIIPFHRSQWKKSQYEAMGLPAKTKDYTFMQNEKFIKPQYHEYRGRMVKDKATNYMPNEYWDFSKSGKENAEAYLQMCARNNKRPKFYKLLENNGDGSYSLKADGSTDGYWKLLIDFKMYDNDGNGSPQAPVRPEFNMAEATRMLESYQGGHSNFPVAQGIVDSFVSEYKENHGDRMYQDRAAGNSNRALLAGAFEDLARNPDELESIRKYRDNVKKLDAEETKLQELRQQIREMTFVKGKRDDKKLQELRDEATKTANRIAVYDKRLLRLEAAAPIQQVLAREKEKVRKASDQKHRDAMKKYREETRAALEGKTSETEIMEREFIRLMKAYEAHASAATEKSKAYKDKIQTQKDTYREDMAIMEREFLRTMKAYEARERVVNKEWETEFRRLLREYDSAERNIGRLEKRLDAQRESVKQGILRRKDSAKRRELRTKIRKTVFELDKLLNRGDKKKNVKSGMTSMVDSVLKLADALFMDEYTNRDMLRNGVGVELTDAEEKLFREAQQILQQAESGAAMENMEFTSEVDAMEQLKKLDRKLTGKMAGLKDVFVRERKRLYGTTVSDLLGKLADEYSRLSEAEDGAVRAAKDENVYAHLLQLQKDVGGTTVQDMTLGQMEAVADAFTMVLTTVRNANKMFAKNLTFKRDVLAAMVMSEIGAAVKKVSKLVRPGKNAIDSFSWNNLKPVYAFARLGSETLKTLYQNIRSGQDVWSRDMQEADAFRREQYRKHNRKAWNLEKQHRFEFESGIVELSLEQIMSLYAYSRREQALDHLLKGGFVFSGSTEVMVKEHGIQRRYLKKDATAYNLTADELLQVVDTLTKEQKAFVEEMQTYLSDVMGGKGNEISLQMYGIKSYGEKNYFPIRSAGQYMERAKEDSFRKEQGQISIVNSGFTKSTTPKANNPITLDGFMNVWAEHVNEMSMYHGFALPMEDFRRVYNYSSPNMEVGNSQSVNAAIENAFGKAATGYIDQLYKDLNGGAVSDNRENLSKKLVGLHKKAAVFASASVVVQQPSAIVRAFALIDPRHFIGPKVDHKRHKQLWEEVKKYAPVAFVKEMGYFDTGMGRTARGFLQAEEYSGIREKAKALFQDGDYRDEILGKAPALADELAWCSIWEAVKRETKAKNPDLDVRSDAFLQIAGARFSEVIDKTQVYDSVLSRSANMRSKALHMNMLTSFLAEPTTSINMLEDALRTGDRQQLKRTVGAVYGSVLLNSLLVSLVYAARDDDEDETYLEKYLSSVAVELVDGINPITYYPFLRDIWSIGQGFDVERADMSLITDFADAAKKVVQSILKVQQAGADEQQDAVGSLKDSLWGMTDSIASLTGLPVKNIRRDIEGAMNLVKTIHADLAGRKTTGLSLMDTVLGDVMGSIPIGNLLYSRNKRDRLYDAIQAGDAAYVQRLKAGYKSEDAYHNAIRQALRDNESRIWEAASAWNSGDMDTYLRIAKEIRGEGRFEQDDIVLAIRAEANSMLESEGEPDSTVKGYFTNEKFGVALSQNNTGMADVIRKDLIDTKVANGKTREEAARSVESAARSQLKELFEDGSITGAAAEKLLVRYGGYDQEEAADKVADWKFESEYGFTYSERGDAYKNGEISQAELRSILMDVGGKTGEEADLQIQVYDWEAQGFEGATISAVRNYNEYCAGARVPKDVYLYIRKVANSTDNDVDASGKTIYYSAMKKIMAEIGGQYSLTATQKYAIARSLGWSDKNIEKYKTW